MATKRGRWARDVRRRAAGIAHGDAHRGLTDAEIAARHGELARSRRSWARDRQIGYPGQHQMAAYLRGCDDPIRVAAWARAEAFAVTLDRLSDADLVHSYRELLCHEPAVEAEDRTATVSRGVDWLERRATSERNASVDEQKAAHEHLFEVRGITEDDVFGRVQ